MHPSVIRELYGDRRGSKLRHNGPRGTKLMIPRRHVIAALLVVFIMTSWTLDTMNVRIVPRPVHETVASMIDSQRGHLSVFGWLPDIDCPVAHNPIDDSPVTFGSVVLLGVLCAGGLIALGLCGDRQQV
jgi:hypothetical protein